MIPISRSARARAAQMLYELFRDADNQSQRIGYGTQYVEVAFALLADDWANIEHADAQLLNVFVARARRVLEVSLSSTVRRPAAAAGTLTWLDELQRDAVFDFTTIQDELDYRRLRERLLVDDDLDARTFADRLYERDPRSAWSTLAQREMYTRGRDRWKNPPNRNADPRQAMALVVVYGQRVLDAMKLDGVDAGDRGRLSVVLNVADSLLQRWRRSHIDEDGRRSLELHEQVLAVFPANAQCLRAVAELAAAFDQEDRALECWRMLVAGQATGSPPWYEAKFHLIELLLRRDPHRAREVMDQHKLLNPTYGPEPWGARLRGLDDRIDRQLARTAEDDA
jgi:hypothetical protein